MQAGFVLQKKDKSTLRTLVVSTILADSEIAKDDNSHAHLPIVLVLQELKFISCSIQSLQLQQLSTCLKPGLLNHTLCFASVGNLSSICKERCSCHIEKMPKLGLYWA